MFKKGDIILMNFDPQVGHEQAGVRPALVVSNNIFNKRIRGNIVCPITNTDRNLPFHVRLNEQTKTKGVVLCDQVKSLDLSGRNARYLEKIPQDILDEVCDILISFIED